MLAIDENQEKLMQLVFKCCCEVPTKLIIKLVYRMKKFLKVGLSK